MRKRVSISLILVAGAWAVYPAWASGSDGAAPAPPTTAPAVAAAPVAAVAAAPAFPATAPAVVATTQPQSPLAFPAAVAEAPAADGAHTGAVTAAQVSVSDAGSVDIHVEAADLLQVLRMLSLQSQRNIIASKAVAGTVSANLYNVTVHEALDAILHSNDCGYVEKGNFIYVYTTGELAEQEKANHTLRTEIFRLNYVPVSDVMAMIKPVISSQGQLAASKDAEKGIDTSGGETSSGGGGGGGGVSTGGNTYAGNDLLVVTDYAENLQRVADMLKEIDRRPQQVLVEATILAATLSDNNAMGIDFSFLGGVDFDSLLSSGTGLSGLLSSNTLNSASSGSSGTSGTTGTGSIASKGFAGFTTGSYDASVPAGGLQVGIVHRNLGVFIQALESVTNTTILANPKVLALDKQAAEVHVGSSFGYQTTTVTQTTSTQTVQFFDTGTTLSFRPYVGADGFIRMEIHPEDSSGGLNASNLPFKNTTEVTCNVMVKDGNTIVIGGLFREQSSTARSQIPGLGSIPILGALFRQQSDTTTRQEIIIMLTPHIIKDDSAYAALSEDQMKAAEQYRVGVRRGMMFFGRERLAETAYENAEHELAKPHPDRGLALWHLNVATNLNPTFLEAIELKQKVSGQVVSSVDNSAIRAFVSEQMMADERKRLDDGSASPAVSDAGAGPGGK
jgi:type IV pilus secretin PilQ/predicted competence protein